MHEVAGRAVTLDALFGRAGMLLWEALACASGWQERFALLDDFLLARLDDALSPVPWITRALGRLRASGGSVGSVSSAAELGCSRRHLVAGFREQVGVSPKLSAGILRFQRAVALAAAGPAGPRSRRAAATTTRRTWSATSTSSRARRRTSSPAAGYRTAGASSATDVPLLEREGEASVLAAALAGAAEGRGAVVVIEGAAGLGKTRLLRHAAELASGARVLTASGSELEHEFGFGVVRQLLERVAAEAGLEGAAGLAAPALGHASDAAGDRFASLHGLYWLVANLASSQPVLLTVDDAQWADVPSLRFLAYLARRVRELPVTLLIASRPPLPSEDRSILETIAAEATTLAPAPLSESAIATLAGPAADPAFVTAVHHATAGNALLVEELLAEARDLAYDMHPTRIPGSDPGVRAWIRVGCKRGANRAAGGAAARGAGRGGGAARERGGGARRRCGARDRGAARRGRGRGRAGGGGRARRRGRVRGRARAAVPAPVDPGGGG